MGKILCAWELGGHLGHVGRFASLSQHLISEGHTISFALRDLQHAEKVLGHLNAPYQQAPCWHTPVPEAPQRTVSIAEILQHYGYLNEDGLTSLYKAWKHMFSSEKPDLILADYAPTALLVANGLNIPTATIGGGFCMPPASSPIPSYVPWTKIDDLRLRGGEERILSTINKAAYRAGLQGIQYLYETFHANEAFLCTYPELDPYGERTGIEYSGVLDAPAVQLQPQNNRTIPEVPTVFAYLKRGYDRLVLHVLHKLGWKGIIFAPELPAPLRDKYRKYGMNVSSEMLPLNKVLPQCDIAICHAGHATATHILLHGKPVLLLPLQFEQRLMTYRVEQLGAGILPKDIRNPDEIRSSLLRLARESDYTSQAIAFACKRSSTNSAGNSIAKRCTQLMLG